MKKIRKIERLVDYHQNAEEMVKDENFQKNKIVAVLVVISIMFIFMAAIAYLDEGISPSAAFVPAVLLLLAFYANTWSPDIAPGSWFQEPRFFQEEKTKEFRYLIKRALFHLSPFRVEAVSEDDIETLKMARDIIEE